MSSTPKCPICGGRITYSSDSFRVLRGGCLPCGWQTDEGWYTVANRDKAVLKFISKVPPIISKRAEILELLDTVRDTIDRVRDQVDVDELDQAIAMLKGGEA